MTFEIYENEFLRDGKPIKIISGAVHYFRNMPDTWEDILKKLKALGCNCVETYCAWNMHEKQKGQYDFSRNLDIASFIKLAQREGLMVIVRPGPYICAEWEFGGLPWWIQTNENMEIRCMNKAYIKHFDRYLDKMCEAGVDSIKIEGRAKSHYYVAVTTNAYRAALDSLKKCDGEWSLEPWILKELDKISHRPYSTGFYFGQPSQTYESAGYVRDYSVAVVVTGYENGCIVGIMKNKFYKGQEFDCLCVKEEPFIFKAEKIFDKDDKEIDNAPHPMMIVKIPCDRKAPAGSLLRMKNE